MSSPEKVYQAYLALSQSEKEAFINRIASSEKFDFTEEEYLELERRYQEVHKEGKYHTFEEFKTNLTAHKNS